MAATISVIMRTKDRPLLLARALRSVLAQTASDFELVVVNDGGDAAVLRKLMSDIGVAEDPRVEVIDNGAEPGRAGALDAGVDRAGGRYFAIHDDDDAWHPEFIERTCAYLDDHPTDAAVATHTEVVFEEITDGVVAEVSRDLLAPEIDVASLVETLWANYIPPIAMVLRRDVVDALGRFRPELPVLEDWEFNLRLLSQYTVGFIAGEPLAYWHQRKTSTGADGNSVIADARDHAMYNLLIRDDYLRRGLAGGESLGPLMAAAMMIRRIDRKADEARAHHQKVIDMWGHAHQDQISALSQMMSLEIGRLRGEVLALRELVGRDGLTP